MPCESCNTQFTIFKHKKSCAECHRLFCLNCLQKNRRSLKSLCLRCDVLTKRPLTRNELQRLKAKDLIIYLQSKHIPTAGCVEKDDLVNLVLAHVAVTGNNATTTSSSNSSSSVPSPGSHYETFRSYFNNLTSPSNNNDSTTATQQSRTNRRDSNSQPNRRRSSNSNFFGSSSTGGVDGHSNSDNPFAFLRQGCQVILDNVTDKLTNNFKFEATPGNASSSRNSSSPSSVTSPSAQSGRAPTHSVPTENLETRQPERSFRDVRVPSRENSSLQRPSAPPPPACASSGAHLRPKPKIPLDILLRETESGCECSEDEESKQQRTISQSTSNLLANDGEDNFRDCTAVPGTSGYHQRTEGTRRAVPKSQSKGSTLTDSSEFSSFEELNLGTTNTVVEKSNEVPFKQGVAEAEAPLIRSENPRKLSFNPQLITRRRSESSLNGKFEGEFPRNISSHQLKKKCCTRCGRKRNELKSRLRRFHEQLTALSTHDVEVRGHLEAILMYLERKRVSLLSQDGGGEESNEESLFEEPQLGHAAAGETSVIMNQPQAAERESSIPISSIDGEVRPEGQEQKETTPKVVYKRRFVKLDDIHSSADLEELSVKQLKEILVLNRVDFKGCCEKKELIERVRRLLDDYHSCPSVDKLPSDDLCKICMDAPIECVILECGHMATCTNCGKVLSECPICRQFIIRVVRFFRA